MVTPTTITGDATLTLSAKGDFNGSDAWAKIWLDGVDLGVILNNNATDDAFDFSRDRGNNKVSKVTGSMTISEDVFASLIKDGFLNLTLDTNFFVESIKHVSGTISFNENVSVPEPSTFALLFLGLAGIGFSRRKIKA